MLGLDVKRTWSWKQRMCGTGILQSKLFGAIIRGSKCLVGAIVLDPIKMLLYDDSVGVFTRHVTNMAVTPSAMAETPCCTQTSRLCPLYVRSYCRLKFVIASIRNFGYLLRKMVENIKFFIRTAKLNKIIPKHIFWPIIDCFSMYVTGGRPTRIQGVVSRRSSAVRRKTRDLPLKFRDSSIFQKWVNIKTSNLACRLIHRGTNKKCKRDPSIFCERFELETLNMAYRLTIRVTNKKCKIRSKGAGKMSELETSNLAHVYSARDPNEKKCKITTKRVMRGDVTYFCNSGITYICRNWWS